MSILETNIEPVQNSPLETSAEILDQIIADFNNPNRELPISTGYRSLTKMFSGFKRNQITILSARPSVGKTCTALNFTINLINKGKKVLFFDLEEQKTQNFERMISNLTGCPLRDDLDNPRLSPAEKAKVLEILGLGRKLLNDKNLYYVSKPNLTLNDMKEIALNLKNIDLVVIDHLTKVKSSVKSSNIYERVTDIASNLRQLSYDIGGTPLLVLAQAGRDARNRKPELNDLKGSGEIEENADVVLMLYAKQEEEDEEGEELGQPDEQEICVMVRKNRHGRTGSTKLLLNRPLQKLSELPRA